MDYNATQTGSDQCLSGDSCRDYDSIEKHPGYTSARDPLCGACLTWHERGIRMLVFDYLDLEQALVPSLSQAMDTQRSGRGGPPMPLAGAPEALQAEIHHAATTWEMELRIASGLSEPPETQRAANTPWHTTVTKRPPFMKVRAGNAVQRATGIILPRIRQLAALPPAEVSRTGCEDELETIPGWEAVIHLSELHRRARSLLGRTHRTSTVPGSCSECCAELWRDEPRYERDPCNIYCSNPDCGAIWDYDAYERYVGLQLAMPRRERGAA